MKDIKDIFENYSENPSDEVWNRLSSRLDKEMPATPQHHTSAWKWVTVALVTAVVGGGATYGVVHYQSEKQSVMTENKVEVPVNEMDDANTDLAYVTEEVAVKSETVSSVTDSEEKVEKEAVGKDAKSVSANQSQASAKERNSESAAQTNTQVPQVVLPANSTLARQLAADPVLKNLSDSSVEWSKPVHLSIPNLFTPNNDGVNDLFFIDGLEQYSSPKLVVRDKNNRVVYQSNDYRNNWGAENCPDGVYNYEFSFTYNGIDNLATGKVRVIRK